MRMKIQTLITLLKNRMENYGNTEVYLAFPPEDPDGEAEIHEVFSHHLHQQNDNPMITCISGIDPDKTK